MDLGCYLAEYMGLENWFYWYDNISSTIKMLYDETVDVLIVEVPQADMEEAGYEDLIYSNTYLTTEAGEYCVIMREENPVLCEKINEMLAELEADGTLDATIDYWNEAVTEW